MKTEILKYICYFDVFNHPVKDDELVNLLGLEPIQVEAEISTMETKGVLVRLDGYCSLQSSIKTLIEQRLAKEKKAQFYFKKLPFYARLIRSFPFVSAIGISGSLSKNVMHDDGDIDYFIITKPGRLWICRTFLVVFKKLFLFNSKQFFCVNYFVDEENLAIPDHNIFTAIETAFLLPVYNKALIDNFKNANAWSQDFVPCFEHPTAVNEVKGKSWLGRFFEFILKGKFGDRIDLWMMKFTYKRWEKKFKDFDSTKFELTMRSNRGVSKHHPRDFQNKVLKAYNERLEKLNLTE